MALLIADAKRFIQDDIEKAVISVPAGAGFAVRAATKRAVEAAGIEVLKIYREPVCAAVGAGFRHDSDEDVLVFDLGAGTLDITVVEWEDGVFEVKAVTHDTSHGGDDFDVLIADELCSHFKAVHELDLTSDPQAMQRILRAAERGKRDVSSSIDSLS